MNDLFSEDPQFRRIQWTKLGDNVQGWPQEIGQLIAERLPSDLNLETTVVFQQVDQEKGYAIGSAVVRDPNGPLTVGIPIIVKSWHVAPFDIYMRENKVFPLTNETLAKVFYQGGIGAGLASKNPPPHMADDVFADVRNPPLGGKYSYSSPLSMLSLIEGTMGADDIATFRKVAADPILLGAFHKRGTFDLLCKYGESKADDSQDKADKARGLAIMNVKKDGPDLYRLLTTSSQVYDPISICVDRNGLAELFDLRRSMFSDVEKDPMVPLDRNGEITLTVPETPYGKPAKGGTPALGEHKNPFVFDPHAIDIPAVTADKFGAYAVQDKTGVATKGWVVPNVINFDGSTSSLKLFLGKALSGMQSRIVGVPSPGEADADLKGESAETGKTGTLLYRDGDKIFATVPFFVKGTVTFQGSKAFTVVDYKGDEATFIISTRIDGIVPVESSESKTLGPLVGRKKTYFISPKLVFVRMPRIATLSESIDDMRKTAMSRLDPRPLKLSRSNGSYVIRGGKLDKYASAAKALKAAKAAVMGQSRKQLAAKVSNAMATKKLASLNHSFLTKGEAAFTLCAMGVPFSKVAQALRAVQTKQSVEIHFPRYPLLPEEVKTAQPTQLEALAARLRRSAGGFETMLKVASAINDAEAVDAVLGLNFINEENVKRFAAARPILEETSGILAKLLLASRLGMEDIPEEAARSAMGHLQKVIEGLGELEVLGREQQNVSAKQVAMG